MSNLNPDQQRQIVTDALTKAGLNKTDPSQALAERLGRVDAIVMRLIVDERKAHGHIRDKAALQRSIGQAYFEELKTFHEGELRSITSSFLAIRATENL